MEGSKGKAYEGKRRTLGEGEGVIEDKTEKARDSLFILRRTNFLSC